MKFELHVGRSDQLHDVPRLVSETVIDPENRMTSCCFVDNPTSDLACMGLQDGSLQYVRIGDSGKPSKMNLDWKADEKPQGAPVYLCPCGEIERMQVVLALFSDGWVYLVSVRYEEVLGKTNVNVHNKHLLMERIPGVETSREDFPTCVEYFFRGVESLLKQLVIAIPMPWRSAVGLFDSQFQELTQFAIPIEGVAHVSNLHISAGDADILMAASVNSGSQHAIVVWRVDIASNVPQEPNSQLLPPPRSAVLRVLSESDLVMAYIPNLPFCGTEEHAGHGKAILAIFSDGRVAEYSLQNHGILDDAPLSVAEQLEFHNSLKLRRRSRRGEVSVSESEMMVGGISEDQDVVDATNELDPRMDVMELSELGVLESAAAAAAGGDSVDVGRDQPEEDVCMQPQLIAFNLRHLPVVRNATDLDPNTLPSHMIVGQNARTSEIVFYFITGNKKATRSRLAKFRFRVSFPEQCQVSQSDIHPEGAWVVAVVPKLEVVIVFALSWTCGPQSLQLTVDPLRSKVIRLNYDVEEITNSDAAIVGVSVTDAAATGNVIPKSITCVHICPAEEELVSVLVIGLQSGDVNLIRVHDVTMKMRFQTLRGATNAVSRSVSHLFHAIIPPQSTSVDPLALEFGKHCSVSASSSLPEMDKLDEKSQSLALRNTASCNSQLVLVVVWAEAGKAAIISRGDSTFEMKPVKELQATELRTTTATRPLTYCEVVAAGAGNGTIISQTPFLLTACEDKTVKMWRLPSWDLLLDMKEHQDVPVICHALQVPLGRTADNASLWMVASADVQGRVLLWQDDLTPPFQRSERILSKRLPKKKTDTGTVNYRLLATIELPHDHHHSHKNHPVPTQLPSHLRVKAHPLWTTLAWSAVQYWQSQLENGALAYLTLPCLNNPSILYTVKVATRVPLSQRDMLTIPTTSTSSSPLSSMTFELANKFYLPMTSCCVSKVLWLPCGILLLLLDSTGRIYLLKM